MGVFNTLSITAYHIFNCGMAITIWFTPSLNYWLHVKRSDAMRTLMKNLIHYMHFPCQTTHLIKIDTIAFLTTQPRWTATQKGAFSLNKSSCTYNQVMTINYARCDFNYLLFKLGKINRFQCFCFYRILCISQLTEFRWAKHIANTLQHRVDI